MTDDDLDLPDDNDLEIPDEYLRQIGRIVVNWNKLEHVLHITLVLALLGDHATDLRAPAVFAHMSFPQKLDVLSSMLRIIDDSDGGLASIYNKDIQRLLRRAQELRNAALHQRWNAYPDGTVKQFDVRAKGRVKVTLKPISVQELEETAAFILDVFWQFSRAIFVPLLPNAAPQQGQ